MSSPETTSGINCPECRMSFDSREELERHSRQQHAQAEQVTQTSKKGNQTSMPTMKERAISKMEEKGKGEVMPENLHQSTSHVCQDCGQVFDSLSDLTAHYKKAHPESL